MFFLSIYLLFLNPAFVVLVFYLLLYFQADKGTDASTSSVDTLPLLLTVTLAVAVGGVLLSIVGYCPLFMIIDTAISSVGSGMLSTIGASMTLTSWLTY